MRAYTCGHGHQRRSALLRTRGARHRTPALGVPGARGDTASCRRRALACPPAIGPPGARPPGVHGRRPRSASGAGRHLGSTSAVIALPNHPDSWERVASGRRVPHASAGRGTVSTSQTWRPQDLLWRGRRWRRVRTARQGLAVAAVGAAESAPCRVGGFRHKFLAVDCVVPVGTFRRARPGRHPAFSGLTSRGQLGQRDAPATRAR